MFESVGQDLVVMEVGFSQESLDLCDILHDFFGIGLVLLVSYLIQQVLLLLYSEVDVVPHFFKVLLENSNVLLNVPLSAHLYGSLVVRMVPHTKTAEELSVLVTIELQRLVLMLRAVELAFLRRSRSVRVELHANDLDKEEVDWEF